MVGAIGGRAGVRWLIALSATAPVAAPAFAGAWGQPEKTSQLRLTVSHAALDGGELWRGETLLESGIAAGFTVILKADTEEVFDRQHETRTGAHLGLQKSFALGDRAAASLTASYLTGDSLEGPFCQGNGFEARGAVGTSFRFLGREAYVNAEAGWRTREDPDCERTLGELAFGMHLTDTWTATVKTWAETGDEGRSTKFEALLSHDFGPVSAGLGWRQEISGAFEEKGLIISTWRSF